MGYRSIKRALGETNLERKCRVLFGLCIAALIAGTFVWVYYQAQGVVLQATRTEGRNALTNQLLRRHWETWVTESNPGEREFLEKILDDFTYREYQTEVLGLDSIELISLTSTTPTDEVELALLRELKKRFDARDQSVDVPGASSGELGELTTSLKGETYEERPLPEKNEYHYYEPVYWGARCILCHQPAITGASAAGDISSASVPGQPFRVVKVVIPYEGTKQALLNAWTGLIGVGILTVFLAMIALYVIVRYVIVKPLKHLRDVSEEISRGNTALRAEIHTHDEFEELADAFNRMLRHMTEAQEELRNVNANLDLKVDELAQLNMRLYDMNRLKSDFLANMSHELRTPLNSIIGFSDVLQGIESLNDKQRRYAQNIQKSGRVLLEMINEVLDLAKLEAGKMEVKPSEFRLDFVLSAQCDMVRSLTEVKNIDLDLIVDENEPPVYQDQSKIQQILTNLLSNAIKFTPEGGRITVSARHLPGDKLELTVADTGIGIADEDREVIFEKFRQSSMVLNNDGLTREHSGTGLGLSIVRELCKLLGGDISFESELGQGSTFKTILPWNLTDKPAFSSELSEKLGELVKPHSTVLRPKTA
ncbi:MAG: HAMP domain-containing protein [Planctomycetaceae bacterium]|nr:HAMP domain-containing protein [Planctomycetales bacterium]MCB9920709.1 HAMP domain-containing protein [Planctomycetaceae bacterium]